METREDIAREAAQWLLERESGRWSEAQEARLNAWLERSTLNRVGYLRLEASWEEANRLKALRRGGLPERVPSVEELNQCVAAPVGTGDVTGRYATFRKWGRPAALAAAVLLAVGAAVLLFNATPFSGERYETPIGGVASVPLNDGSSVILNTDSRVRVRMTSAERRVDLTRGEAFFDVAKDPARPFVVRAGDRRVVALGTKFSVRTEGEDVRVVVTEGRVAISPDDDHVVESTGVGTGVGATLLTAGDVARADETRVAVQRKDVADAEQSLSWRSGYLVFNEITLAEAVAEFNRYNRRRIVIGDPAIANVRLTGKFRSTNYETFVRLLENTSRVHARFSDDRIELGTK